MLPLELSIHGGGVVFSTVVEFIDRVQLSGVVVISAISVGERNVMLSETIS